MIEKGTCERYTCCQDTKLTQIAARPQNPVLLAFPSLSLKHLIFSSPSMPTSLADEVFEAVEIFMATLDKIAKNHKRCVHFYYSATSPMSHAEP